MKIPLSKFGFRNAIGRVQDRLKFAPRRRQSGLAALSLIQQSNDGMALVVTLSLVVLVTIAAMAFLSRSMANRAVESSRSNQILAKQIADTAADYVTGQFLQEIAKMSTSATISGVTIYLPTSNTFAIPQRPLPSSFTSDKNFANLIRRSMNESANGIGEINASTHTASTASRNGRTVGLARWNAPQLVGAPGFTTTPNWIYVNRDGSVSSSGTTTTIGRFAYNVYDVGGLLDINVAGYPASGPAAISGASLAILKATLAGADLSVIPGITDQTALVNWRNTINASSTAAYVTAVTNSATNGFLRRQTGENRVLSRQDLIKLATSGTGGITTDALPYLSTFNTALSAPASVPTTPAGSTTDYYASRDNPASANRFLPNVRVTTNFTRSDGRPAKIGEPLIAAPFALSRLAGIGLSGPVAPATATTIQRDFGLVWQNNRWEYCGPSGSSIQSAIAAIGSIGNREPNFFELLKAGIASGSLGRTSQKSYTAVDGRDANQDYQIIQIGASLIDQYDADSFPTRIGFDSTTFSGVENLPYLARVYEGTYRLENNDKAPSDGVTVVNKPYLQEWLLPVVWNPHAQPYAGPTSDHPGPAEFRFVIKGCARGVFEGSIFTPWKVFPDPAPAAGADSGIKFTVNTSRFGEPTFLTKAVGATAEAPNDQPAVPGKTIDMFGILLGQAWAPDQRLNAGANDLNGNPVAPTQIWWTWAQLGGLASPWIPYATFQLQYKDPAGAWIPYTEMANINVTGGTLDNRNDCFVSWWPRVYWFGSDPRTDRFGAYLAYWNLNDTDIYSGGNPTKCTTIRTGVDEGYFSHAFNAGATGWTFNGGWAGVVAYLGTLSENKATSLTRYTDSDGVLRRADGAYTTGSPNAGYPLIPSNEPSRPVVLDRPFRTVGEMGYAFRGAPWKHLDFFSAESADAALLGLFSVNETPALSAGIVNPNTRQSLVLQAVMKGAILSELDATTISASDAKTIADALVTRTSDSTKGPLMNPDELVTKFAQDISFALSDNTIIKRRREAPIRALSGVSNTRTWNLMIDVIAQSGRFTGPSVSANDFIVEGEKRLWKHIALDRYTGRIIAQTQEPVNE